MKKIKIMFTILTLVAFVLFLSTVIIDNQATEIINRENRMMSNSLEIKNEFNTFVNELNNFPITFVYDNSYYHGFDHRFIKIQDSEQTFDKKIEREIILHLKDTLAITILASYYPNYDAYDYKVFFENISSDNSAIIECLDALNYNFLGSNPVLKGIGGDHSSQYRPYEYNLTTRDANFTSLLGRSNHEHFPYFNLEYGNGGVFIAVGWGGTWQADFKYDAVFNKTNVVATGTVGLQTYLKPGEVIRTPLIGIVRYFERDEDKAMNKWRKWIIDCNLPKDNSNTLDHVQPSTSVFLAMDTGRPNSDGSISEGHDSWKKSIDAFYNNGLTADFRWMDAGWYLDSYRKTVVSDWWGTVGTWELDTFKWPGNSFRESVDYARERGTKTIMWFEPERVTHLNGMVQNFGYDRAWVLSDHGNNNVFVNNLGIRECLNWTVNRILKVMEEQDIDLYREDFNLDPYLFWNIGDGYQGKNRKGITENLYMQGHYELFDRIIAWCAENDKCTYVDSCASGGGRNDLETIRRSVPFLRSDSDRTTIELRLAMTTRLVRWLPFTGSSTKESLGQLTTGIMDTYVLRASMLPHFSYSAEFYYKQNEIDWEALRNGQNEWKDLSEYFFKDFYVLTPYRSTTDSKNWTVYQYFDADTNSGVIQAFRLPNCEENTYLAKVKGVDPNKYYSVYDIDGNNNITKIKGSALMSGLPIYAKNSRTALIIYIRPFST